VAPNRHFSHNDDANASPFEVSGSPDVNHSPKTLKKKLTLKDTSMP
jgi:hypothetical protein